MRFIIQERKIKNMSISPKVLDRKKDKFTTFHMRINNNSNEDISGYIKYKISKPNGKIEEKEFGRTEKIKANSQIDIYDKYYLEKDAQIGRYHVDGMFFWNNQNILSDTNKNDFFDVK